MPSVFEPLIGALRPFMVKGKGRVFDFVTPRSGTRTVRVWGSYRMTLDLADVVHRQIFMGCFGRDMTVWAKNLLPPGGTFLDVGAHAGYFTLLAAHRVGRSGRICAVEPNPRVFAVLEESLRKNQVTNVAAHALALADVDGNLRLYLPPVTEQRDYNVTCLPRPDWTPVDVPCRRLDDCLAAWGAGRIDLMKMDVEGAEPRVLAGGAQALKAGSVRHLICEVNGPRLVEGGSSPADLVRQLGDLGFRPARLARGRAVPVPPEGWDLDPAREHDRLFVHRSAQ
jgi:FkbM family methyltransferase